MAAALGAAVLLALAACGGDDAGDTVAASCEPESFLPVLQGAFDDPDADLRVVEARVAECANGYARVFAVPDESDCTPGVGGCFESEQVFLAERDGAWAVVDSGTGLSCDDADPGPALQEVCEGLASG